MKFFSLIYQGDIHLNEDDKVIPKTEFSKLLSGLEIVKKAKEDASLLSENTTKECEELQKKAFDEGFQEGLVQLNQHFFLFEEKAKSLRHELTQSILPIALKAAKKVVGEELKIHPERIVDIVRQALTPVSQNHKFTIYVNKADKDTLENHKPEIKEILERLETLSIQEREDISPGGCVIETESGIINASLENQWRALEAAFQKYTKKG